MNAAASATVAGRVPREAVACAAAGAPGATACSAAATRIGVCNERRARRPPGNALPDTPRAELATRPPPDRSVPRAGGPSRVGGDPGAGGPPAGHLPAELVPPG